MGAWFRRHNEWQGTSIPRSNKQRSTLTRSSVEEPDIQKALESLESLHSGGEFFLARLLECLAQGFHLIVQMAHHGAFCELRVFFEKGIHDLIMLAHRIFKPMRQMQR